MFSFIGNRKVDEKAVRGVCEALPHCAVMSVLIDKGDVRLVLETHKGADHHLIKTLAEERVLAIKHAKSLKIVFTAERAAKETTPKAPKAPEMINLGVGQVVVVGSGKGGVGKSTTAINLAAALMAAGKTVGVLDADIYGPSLPRLTGTRGAKPARVDDKFAPIEAHGLKLMSIGYLVAEKAPMIWRGPMVHGALGQLLAEVDWSGLDVLVIDLPPGTGDIQLSLAQKIKIDGAVIVSTPQDLALIDARKGLEMFRRMEVPVLGIVENMSYFCCPKCAHRSDIFGHGGARKEAVDAGVAFLGEIPLDGQIRALSDAGVLVALDDEHAALKQAYGLLAGHVLNALERA